MAFPFYPNNVQLYGTMATFGQYSFIYTPPEGEIDNSIEISITSAADLEKMVEVFCSFLKAAGYYLSKEQMEELVSESKQDLAAASDFPTAAPSLYTWPSYGDGYTIAPGAFSNDTITF